MISAVEMHKIAEERNYKYFEEALEKVNQQILSIAKKGKYSMDICINYFIGSTRFCDDDNSERFVNALNEFGYKTQKIRKELACPGFDKCLYFVTVSW